MGKKMKIPSLFKNKDCTTTQPWQWPSCNQPKTTSFRASDDIFTTINSFYFEPIDDDIVVTPDSLFTNSSSESASLLSTDHSEEHCVDGESLENVVRGVLKSDRLFFEPGDTSSSILTEAKTYDDITTTTTRLPFKESIVLPMESFDPYVDFRMSMEEMVMVHHGLKDWDCLEELLCWYLMVNEKENHGFIVGAFVDLVTSLFDNGDDDDDSFKDDSTFYFSVVSSSLPSSSSACLSSASRS